MDWSLISKRFLLLYSLLLTASFLTAQISGTILNKESDPVEFINIILYQQSDSLLYRGTITNAQGFFQLDNINNGTYYLIASGINYQSEVIQNISIENNEPLQLPTIIIKDQAFDLEGVEVKASKMKIEHTKEGMVLDVQASLLTKGSSILELLERSPGVFIDQRNGEFILNGQSGTLIMINGKSQRIPISDLIQMLKGMDGSNVKAIELISNPSAKYDAEGGAIVNIQLAKSEFEGTNGSISLNLGRGWGNKYGGNITANHFSGKVNFYGNYSLNQDDSFSDWQGIGSSVVPILNGYNEFDFTSNNWAKTTSSNALLGLEYTLSSTSTFGASIAYNLSNAKQTTRNLSILRLEIDSTLISRIQRIGNNRWNNGTANLFYRKQFKKNASFGIDLDYLHFEVENPNEINNQFLDKDENPTIVDNVYYATQNKGTSATTINLGVFKMDYQMNLMDGLKIETGLKTSYSQTENQAAIFRLEMDQWTSDERTITEQTIKESIGAGYLSFDYNLKDRTAFGIGLRYEMWNRNFSDDELDRAFGRLFPTAYFTQKVGEFNSLQATYNRRIARPSYNDLASFLSYNGPTSVFTGNSLLLATITDNLKLTFQKGGKNISLFYRHESNPIVRYQISRNEDANVALISPQNVRFQKSIGLDIYLPFQLTSAWSFNIGGSVARRFFEVTHTEVPKKKAYNALNLNGSTSIKLPKDFSMEVSGWYVSKHYNGSIRVNGFGVLNAGFKKDFGAKHGSLQFSINDLFQTFKIRSFIGELTEEAFDSKAEVYYKAESGNRRIFRITYSRAFGSQKIKTKKINKSWNEEEGRIVK